MSDDTPYMVVRDFEKPRNPWRYTVPETGYTVEGEFFKDLFDNVRRHCEANGLPQPYREDIEDAACRETNPGPSKCRKRPPKPVAGALPHLSLHLAERFLKTVWHVFKERKLVSREEAERRIEICRGNPEKGIPPCPMATSIGGCAGCFGFYKMVTKMLGDKGNPIPDDDDHNFCSACGCHLPSKVWCPQEALDRAETVKPLYQEGRCWRLEDGPPGQ